MTSTPASFDATSLTRLGRVGAVAPSPDGRWLAVAVSRLDEDEAKYVSDLWRISLDDPSAAPTRLTRGAANDRTPRFRRDGSLGFLSNRNPREGAPEPGDEERTQLWVLPASGGEPMPLTDEPLGVNDFAFASHGDRLVVQTDVLPDVPHDEQRQRMAELRDKGPSALRYHDMPVRYWDHWIERTVPHLIAYDERGQERVDLTPQARREHRECEWDLSRDGSTVAVTRRTQGADRVDDVAMRVIDVASGRARDLGAADGVELMRPRFSPDGKQIACVHEQRDPRSCPRVTLHLLTVDSGEQIPLAEHWDRWPTPEAWTRDGEALLVTADDRGEVPVFRVGIADGEVVRITSPRAGGSHADVHIVPGTDALVGIRSRIVHPPEPFRVALRADAQPALLASLSGFAAEQADALARWECVTVEADDGAAVQTLFVRPATEGPHPLLLWIHGGPIAAWGDGWHWRWNPLVAAARGYAVALPNPRGSTGFGHAFIAGIWGNVWGEQCYRDLMGVTDALESRQDVDAARTAAMGGSFGGYMTNWIGGNTDRFRCLITHASLFDLSSFYGVTDHPGWFALQLGGTPHTEQEFFERYSPHRFVAQWKTPTLVIHGDRDYRVPVSEALALFEALRLHDVEAELLVFPDENHWIMRPRNIREWYGTVLEFLDRHLQQPDSRFPGTTDRRLDSPLPGLLRPEPERDGQSHE